MKARRSLDYARDFGAPLRRGATASTSAAPFVFVNKDAREACDWGVAHETPFDALRLLRAGYKRIAPRAQVPRPPKAGGSG